MQYKIWYIKNTREHGHYSLETFLEVIEYDKPKMELYEKVNEGDTKNITNHEDPYDILETLFAALNNRGPVPLYINNRTMNVGDIIQLNDGFYYCNLAGFKKVEVDGDDDDDSKEY